MVSISRFQTLDQSVYRSSLFSTPSPMYRMSRIESGSWGEAHALKLLNASGYIARPSEIAKTGDISALCPITGEVWRVEVKAAQRRQNDGKWAFPVFVHRHTDYRLSDVVLLLAVLKAGLPVPFVIPSCDIPHISCITISSHPLNYTGKYAEYRQQNTLVVLP